MKEYPFELILGATLAKALRLRAAVLVAFFATLRPTSGQASFTNASSDNARMLAGVGNRARNRTIHSPRLECQYRRISGK